MKLLPKNSTIVLDQWGKKYCPHTNYKAGTVRQKNTSSVAVLLDLPWSFLGKESSLLRTTKFFCFFGEKKRFFYITLHRTPWGLNDFYMSADYQKVAPVKITDLYRYTIYANPANFRFPSSHWVAL